MNCLLSIGITSYNRPKELKRCLESIDTEFIDKIEIIISEDKSPKREEIRKIIDEFRKTTQYEVISNYNSENLGYDRNLKKLMSLASGKYILYMSDDDKLIPNSLSNMIKKLENLDTGVIYSPFYEEEFKKYSRFYDDSINIPSGGKYLTKHIYDSILFSGLIYNVDRLKNLDAEKFLNKNYFQVYMYLYGIHFFGGYYSNEPLVYCVGDGENGYGISDSSVKNELLANRKSFLSNLQFHEGLISVIKMFDKDYDTNYFISFEKEYNLRTVSGLSNAAKIGKKELRQYWEKLKTLNIQLSGITKICYILYTVLPYKLINMIFGIPKKILLRARGRR